MPGVRSRKFHRLAVFAVGYNVLVVVWGAFVRATGSGAGCGSHWPLCNGEVVPRAPAIETLIELSHRLTSGLDGLLIVALLVAAFRTFPRGHRVRFGALASFVFLLGEVLVGAGLVRFGLVADDASAERATVMAFHLVNTFFLLAALTATALWSGGETGPRLRGRGYRVPLLLTLGGLSLLLLGASGAVTALGDTLFPVGGAAATGGEPSATAHFLVRLRIFHPIFAVGAGAYVFLAAAWVARLRPVDRVRRTAVLLATLFLVQMLWGLCNVALGAPVWSQLGHLLLADLVWLAFVGLAIRALGATTAESHSRDPRLYFTDGEFSHVRSDPS